jgi:deoxyribonuclease-1
MNFLRIFVFTLVVFPQIGFAKNVKIANFREAKKWARQIHSEQPYTLYCHCKILSDQKVDLKSCGYRPKKDAKRAHRLEWEHVVPAEAFGHSFKEWREGVPTCTKRGKRFKGRKCAETNAEFSRMEADLYNLWPEVGELNGLRSNYSMAAIDRGPGDFGGCQAKVRDRKFEPMDAAKGIVARTYQYMHAAYPGRGIISDKNQKLFEAWDKLFPVTAWECKRAAKIRQIQGNLNPILESRCRSG